MKIEEILDSHLNNIENCDKSSFDFLLAIADYAKFISENEVTKRIIELKILKERDEIVEDIKRNNEQIILILKKTKDKIEKIIGDKRLKDNKIIELLKKFDSLLQNEERPGTYGKTMTLYDTLLDTCISIDNLSRNLIPADIFKKNKKYDGDKFVFDDKTENLIKKNNDLKNKLGKKRKTEVWGSYEKIYSIHKNINNEEDVPDIYNINGWWQAIYVNEIDKAKKQGIGRNSFFDRENYLYLTKRVNNEIKKQLISPRNKSFIRGDDAINKITLCKIGSDLMVAVNDDFKNYIEVNLQNNESWGNFYKIAFGEEVKHKKSIIDYFNSNKKNKLYSKTGLPPQKILRRKNDMIEFNIEKEIIMEKAFKLRQKKD